MARRFDRTTSGPVFWAAVVVVLYFLLSVALAIVTADTCGDLDAPKRWQIIPPAWECEGPRF